MRYQQLLPVLLSSRYRATILAIQLIIITILKFWILEPHSHIGFLYLLPVAFAAWTMVPIWLVALLSIGCATMVEASHHLPLSIVRFAGELVGFCGCGLIIGKAARMHRARAESDTALDAFLDASPVPMVFIDETGRIELANRAAVELIAPPQTKLAGIPLTVFLIDFQPPTRTEPVPEFICRVRRGDGTSFVAKVSLRRYIRDQAPKLAVVISEISPENERGRAAAAQDASSVPSQLRELSLSEREARVVRLLVQGLGNKEIASRLMMSESTIKNTIHQVFAKTGARSRSHLVSIALETLERADVKNAQGDEQSSC